MVRSQLINGEAKKIAASYPEQSPVPKRILRGEAHGTGKSEGFPRFRGIYRFRCRRIALSILLLAAGFGCSVRPDTRIESAPKELSRVEFKAIVPETWQLANGLKVYFYHDDELPVVSGALLFKGGTLWESPGSKGVAAVMGHQLRQGGAGELGASELNLELEKLAIEISSSVGMEIGKVDFSCLSSDFDRAFSIFSDIVLRPRFEERELNLWRSSAIEEIRRRTDEPNSVAGISLSQLMYFGSPYDSTLVESDVGRISRLDILREHRRLVRPNEAILIVTGNVTREQVESITKKYLGNWQPSAEKLADPPKIKREPKPGIYFIKLPLEQSTIYMGQLGVPRLTPDYLAIEVFNSIFGESGFGNRLMRRLRLELGLTYATFGGISPGIDRGLNTIIVQTKAETTRQTIEEAYGVLSGMQQGGVTATELEEAKKSIENQYVFNFDSIGKSLGRFAKLALLNYPKDYDQTYLPNLMALNQGAINAVARTRWDLSKFVIVVVGNESAYNQLLEAKKDKASVLNNFELKQVKFDQKLVL